MKFYFIALFVSLCCLVYLQAKRPQARLADQIVFDFNEQFASYSSDTLRISTFGYARAASSTLWLRFLQHTPPKKVEKDQVSWIYLDLLAVSELDPEFYFTYEFGGIFLSVITEDKLGAEKILLKGIERFPDKWRLRAYLAYHYLFEINEPEKAGEQFYQAAKLPGAPALMAIRASSFLDKSGMTKEGISLLKEMYESSEDPKVKEKLLAKLKSFGVNVHEK